MKTEKKVTLIRAALFVSMAADLRKGGCRGTRFAPRIRGFTIAERRPFCYKDVLECRNGWFVMTLSEVHIQRALSAALRKLNTGATFLVDVRTINAQPATAQTARRRASCLRHTIDLILEQFEKEKEASEEVMVEHC